MLVIGRKPGEYVVVDGNIFIKVIKHEYWGLRLAIEAPEQVKITRGELEGKNNNKS